MPQAALKKAGKKKSNLTKIVLRDTQVWFILHVKKKNKNTFDIVSIFFVQYLTICYHINFKVIIIGVPIVAQ